MSIILLMAAAARPRPRTWLLAAAVGMATLVTHLAPVRATASAPRPDEASGQHIVDEETFEQLSDGGRNSVLSAGKPEPGTRRAPTALAEQPGGAPAGPTDPASLVNDPTTDGLNDTQASTSLTLAKGNLVAAFSDSGSAAVGNHFTGYSVSTDGAASFLDRGTLPDGPEGDGSNGVLASDASTGRVYLATMSRTGQEVLQLWRSDDGGLTFGAPVNPTPGFEDTTAFQDRLWVAVDNFPGGGAQGQGNVYLAWQRFGGPELGSLELTRSTDGGETWSPDRGLTLETVGSTQGPFVTVAPDHSVFVFWWARRTLNGPGALHFARSTDQGLTFGPVTPITGLRAYGPNGDLGLPFGFRTNSFPQVAVNPASGHLYLVFNDDPVGTDGAGVFLMVSTDSGTTWSAPVKVESDTGTSDQWQPAVGVSPDGARLLIAFYDNHEDGYWIRRMGVIGGIEGETVILGHDFPLSPAFPPVVNQDPLVGRTFMGSYDQVISDDEFFYATWTDNRDPHLSHPYQPDVRFAKVPHDLDERSADLAVTVGGPSGPVLIQQEATWTTTVTNDGPDAAAFGSLETLLPDEFIFQSVTTTQGSCSGSTTGRVTCALGTLGSGSAATVTVHARAGVVPGPVTFAARAESLVADPSGANDFATSTATVELRPGTESVRYTSGDLDAAIPGGGTVEIPIEVPENAAVLDAAVRVRLSHTWVGDLTLWLVAPDGTEIALVQQRGSSGQDFGLGATDCSGIFTELSDHARTPVWAASPPFAGILGPEQPFARLLDRPAGGTWKLRVEDAFAEDVGTVHCWQLDILRDTVTVPPPVSTTSTSAVSQTSTTAPSSTSTTTPTSTSTSTSSTTTTLPPTPKSLRTPYSVWSQGAPLDGSGAWVGMATDPTAAAGQAPPAYFFAHSFTFAASSAWGVVGLVDDPAGKFAVLNVIDPQGGSHAAAVPLAWAPGRLYFVVVYQLAPGTWGAWVYDHTAATWVGIGQLSLPASWGKLAPTTATAALWYGSAPTACAAYPRADVLFHPPTGFVGTTPLTATLAHTTTAGGDCPTETSVEQGLWARYRPGTG